MTRRRDTSRDDMSWACRLANRDGYDETMIYRALAAKPSGRRDPGSLKYQRLLDTKGLDTADAYAWRTARKAVDFVRTNPAIRDRPSALLAIVEIEAVAGALPWRTYGGPEVRRALEACFVVAERIGSVNFGFALREWSETSGQDFSAIRKHRNRLVELEWLRRNPADRLGRTARFRLRLPRHIHSHGRSECAPAEDRLWLSHDAFRPAALGDAGWYVLTSLAIPGTPDSLSLRTGVDIDELHILIRRLEASGLATLGDGEIVVRADDLATRLDAVAAEAGTAGDLALDALLHAQERVAFRARQGVNVRGGTH